MGVLRYLLAGSGTIAAVATHHVTVLLVLVGAYLVLLGLAAGTACYAVDEGRRTDALRLALFLIPRRAEELRILAPLLADKPITTTDPRPETGDQRLDPPAADDAEP